MSEEVLIKETYIDLQSINFAQVSCPSCGATDHISLKGFLMIPYEEEYENHQVQTTKRNKEKTFDLKQILCYNCHTKSLVIDSLLFAMQKTNADLLEKLRIAKGHPSLLN